MTRQLIAEGWESYSRGMQFPEDAPWIHDTIRDAFFGGASWLFVGLLNLKDPSTQDMTPADVERFEAIRHEIRAYFLERWGATQGVQ